ncbi:MAG: hypothetical protein AAGA36_00105 [Pseudomonadota bacterium]
MNTYDQYAVGIDDDPTAWMQAIEQDAAASLDAVAYELDALACLRSDPASLTYQMEG